MKSQLYQINSKFAQVKNLPVYFEAVQLSESSKALYVFGHGTTKAKSTGNCMACGRQLTHPVSKALGIGPECGKHYWDWDAIGGYSEENIEKTTQAIEQKIKVDCWIPKSVVVHLKEKAGEVSVPENHKMLKRKDQPSTKKATSRQAKLIDKKGKKIIKITFPFDRDVINQVKTIPGRKYKSTKSEKFWIAPLSVEAIKKLEKMGFDIDPPLLQFKKKKTINTNELSTDFNIPGLGGELFPFQKEGVAFVEARNGRALIADEMGLGKTVQVLAWLQMHPEKRPALIVCPASLKLNWKQEAQHWMESPNVQILGGTDPSGEIYGDILIINYHVLHHWVQRLQELDLQVFGMDESHYFKNNKAKRTKAVKKIAKGIPHVLPITGTPIVNRPKEVLNAIQIVDKTVVPNQWSFLQRYCGAKHNGFGWDFSGASNTQELHNKLTNTIMIRRKKKDVLKDLPDKIRSFVPMEINNHSEYQQAENDFISYVRGKVEKDLHQQLQDKLGADQMDLINIDQDKLEQLKNQKAEKASGAAALTQIEELKQLAVKGKLDQTISWIEDFINSGEKLVVFATHKFVINELMKRFSEVAVKVDGSVTAEDRDLAVSRFQDLDQVKLFIGNMQAAGVGLTLTAASSAAFLELPWTPGDLNQAMDRIHRIGQKETCNYYFLLAQNTIEEKIARMLDEKTKILDSVLDGKKTADENLLSQLIESYKKPHNYES